MSVIYLGIPANLEFLAEAVYQFYQVHLDKMIRKNNSLCADFYKMGYKQNDTTGEWEPTGLLELDCDARDPSMYADEQTVIPGLEKHFAFSTT